MRTKYLPVILWGSCILLATNNSNFQSLLFAQEVDFNLRLFPDFSDMLITNDINLHSKTYVFQKLGHALSFGILFLLLIRSINHNVKAIILCSLFAFFTEFLQLFFERSGRFSDILIDIVGVFLAYLFNVYVKTQGGWFRLFGKRLKKITNAFADEKSH